MAQPQSQFPLVVKKFYNSNYAPIHKSQECVALTGRPSSLHFNQKDIVLE
jgi:hypothetical protein